MFTGKVLSGDVFTYHPKNNPTETREAFEVWFTFDGVPYSFKMIFFTTDSINKAKAAVASGKITFALKPDRNTQPVFIIQ